MIYQWAWSVDCYNADVICFDGLTEGTLEAAVEAAQSVAYGLPGPPRDTTITLRDEQGFVRGWVHGDGQWRLA